MNLKLDFKKEAKTTPTLEWNNFEGQTMYIFPCHTKQ